MELEVDEKDEGVAGSLNPSPFCRGFEGVVDTAAGKPAGGLLAGGLDFFTNFSGSGSLRLIFSPSPSLISCKKWIRTDGTQCDVFYNAYFNFMYEMSAISGILPKYYRNPCYL